jgi:maltose-binding protein MalE
MMVLAAKEKRNKQAEDVMVISHGQYPGLWDQGVVLK